MSVTESMPPFLRLDEYHLPSHCYAGICPYADRVRAEYDRWCTEMTHLTAAGRERYRRQNLSYVASRSFPHPASYKHAVACALDVLWRTLFDDYHGPCSPEELVVKRERVVEILRGARPRHGEHPLLLKIDAFRELSASLAPAHWLDRYIAIIEDYFRKGVEREATFKRERHVPSFAELLEFRPYSIAMFPYFRMVEVELDLFLPEQVTAHPVVRRIEYLLARITAWQNDAFSLVKEVSRRHEEAEVINLAFVLQHEHGISLAEACAEMLRIHDTDVAEFAALANTLPDFGQHQRAAEQLIHHLAIATSGVETFYRNDTARYAADGTWTDEYAT